MNGKFGFINNKGEIAIPASFDNAYGFSEGLAPVKSNGKWGYINRSGEFVIQPKYDGAEGFINGVAQISNYNGEDQSECYIDKKGNMLGKFDVIG